ncbi:DUF7002 family protein [Bordetella genomosp. 8]|uniref:DUF7002 family protein n=1 Tax=Bordetella genomosp. 8 TaxID=1416806 RepID=UPI0012FD111F|nr:hypothetical protein [Bordetella genomosp. 8]
MSPEELAAKHPRLYHITYPEALTSIREHGLLSTSRLLTLFESSLERRTVMESQRRATSLIIRHPIHGEARLTDNLPLSSKALANCLEDGLTPADWLRLLNQRVFFWVDDKSVDVHLRASIRLGVKRVVLMLDTLSVLRACWERVELSPINTGSTLRRPARRGLSTFTPAQNHSLREWQKLRGKNDRIKELTIKDGVFDIAAHLIGHYAFPHLDPDFVPIRLE